MKSKWPTSLCALVLAAAFLAVCPSFGRADGDAPLTSATGSFRTLQAALTAIGTTNAVLTVRGRVVVERDAAVPDTVTLQFVAGGSLAVAAGITVMIAGPLQAPLVRIFEGSGSIDIKGTDAYPQWWGAKADGVNDDGYALQAAIDSEYTGGGGTVRLPAGTYLLGHITGLYYALKSRDGVNVIGEGDASVLKAGNGLRAPGRGVAILYNHEDPVTKCRFANFTVDYNGKNNLRLASWGYTGIDAIVSDISRLGADHGSEITIENLLFKDVTGAHCVWIGNYPDNHDNIVRNCRIRNVGQSVPGNQIQDHSSLYIGGVRAQVTGNVFANDIPCNVSTAIEIHSTDTVVSNNSAVNYSHGVNIGGEANDCARVLFENNTFRNCRYGIALWHFPPFVLGDVTIMRNTITVRETDGTPFPPSSGIMYGNGFVTSQTNMSGLTISGNTISQETVTLPDAMPNTGIDIEGADAVAITSNTIFDMNGEAVYLQSHAAGQGMRGIIVEGNSIRNVGRTSTPDRKRAIVLNAYATAAGGMSDIIVKDNVIAGNGSMMSNGIVFNSGSFANVQISGNSITGTTSSPILILTTDTSGFQVQ